jgi:uncharacterized protein with HEPN domain
MPSTPSRSIADRLQDILDNIQLARNFVAGQSFEDFRADQRTSYAVVRCLEIISEASRHLPTDLKERHPDIPWTDIAGAGNIYRHQYHHVQHDLIWRAVQQRLPPLSILIEQELKRLKE